MGGDFGILVVVGLALLVGALLALGRYYPGTGADVLDWKPTRSTETEAELELDDIDQMLAAQNERRRRRGERERSLEEIELGVAQGLREQHARQADYRASLEDSAEAARDLEELLAATNQRRSRRGLSPLTAEGLRAELAESRRPKRRGPGPTAG
jgi:hypothetical protein